MSWTAHPFRRRRARGVLALVVLIGFAAGTALLAHAVLWGVFAGVVLFLSLEAFFLPTRYRIGEEDVQVRGAFSSSTRPFAQYRCVYEDANGLTLSPYRRGARGRGILEPYRATRLLLDGVDREIACAAVRARIGGDVEWLVARDTRGSKARTNVVPT